LEPFSLFDYTPMGLIILVTSIAYMVLIGRHLLPSRGLTHMETDELTTEYELRDYMAELHVQPSSPLVGKTIVDTRLGEEYDLTVMGVIRDGRVRLGILPNAHVRAGDRLLVKGRQEEILRICDEIGVLPVPEHILEDEDLKSSEVTMAEVVVSQLANFIGKSLKDIDFRNRYGMTVLAIWRRETGIETGLADVPLQLGDTLLVQGRRERIEGLRDNNAFLLLRSPERPSHRLATAPINLLIFVSMITLVSFGILHISVAAVLGAILSVLFGCLSMDEAYNSIEWKSVFLIAGMLPMGIAMEKTGTAQFLSDQIINLVGGFGPAGIMIGLFILTTIITEFMSNAAAAVLVAPIAISAALSVGADPRAFVMGVGIAASNSFMFPIGHQASVLVYGPGGYRFFDYTKVGLPLTIIIWVLMVIFLPIFWPL
jgi:di/tricarboxylate transporter